MILIPLFFIFFKIGFFAIGGGLATLPFLFELARTTDWISIADVSNLVAISESTPGPLGVNMATYAGFLNGGVFGSVTAVMGLITPSIIISLIIAQFLQKFKDNLVIKDLFYGLRAASCALILAAFVSVSTLAFFGEAGENFSLKGILLAIILFFSTRKLKWHPVIFIFISAICGIIFKF